MTLKAGIALIATLGFAAARGQVEDIAKVYARQTAALKTGDERAFFSAYALDAYVIDLKGRKMPMSEMRDWWTPHLRARDGAFILKSIKLLSKKNDTATVRIVREMRIPGRTNIATFDDTWRKGKQGWVLRSGRAVAP